MPEKTSTTLPKWPFLAGDLTLVILSCFIVIATPKPMSGLTIFASTLSVILGMLIYVTPYLIEHLTAQQNIKLKQASAETTLLKAIELASDLLNRTEEIHGELMKAILLTKQFPAKLEEKTEELMEAIDSDKTNAYIEELREITERLESIPAGLITPIVSGNAEKQTDEIKLIIKKSLTQIESNQGKFETLLKQLSDGILEKQNQTQAYLTPNQPRSSQSNLELNELEVVADLDSEFPDEINKQLSAEVPQSTEDESEDILADNISNNASRKYKVIKNGDGATRLLVGAFIGISNKLFIRGEGPGLSWDKGKPMELVGIGKWEWKSYDVHSTINCKVLINDEQWTDSEIIAIKPNTTFETSASF